MNESIIRDIESEFLKTDIPEFRVGDTVRVHQRLKEGKSGGRIQVFEGLVIKRQQGGVQERFTVRKLSGNVGVEKTFPIHSPMIEKIEVVRKGKVRRARLLYIRDRVGKAAKVKERMR
ncbi:MAG: 50S ribosomal protein L19 [Tissierellia bacterium]|jgi:large subunit ribosomal protein L19|nr:50S ribosomal protein L19 [Bacillota bacterium]NLL22215.1 50S ribosomal protein L19 [Tissierellia bacterium]